MRWVEKASVSSMVYARIIVVSALRQSIRGISGHRSDSKSSQQASQAEEIHKKQSSAESDRA